MKYKKTGFTLVELIVVVVILGILSTVGFVSYSTYLGGSRDSNRLTQLSNIKNGLSVYTAGSRLLPQPEDSIDILANSNIIAYQGYAGERTLEIIGYQSGGRDPKDNTYFTYYVDKSKKNFQVMGFLEDSNNLTSGVFSQTYAAGIDYSNRFPTVMGSKLGILVENGTNTPVQEVSSLSSGLDIALTGDTYDAYYTDDQVITGDSDELVQTISNGSCKRLLETGRHKGSGVYNINPTGVSDIQVYCDMETDGGGWTKVIRINRGDTTWNAYTTSKNTPGDLISGSGGLMISQFSSDSAGEDLEYMFTVDEVQKGPIYTDVDYQMWDNTMGSSYFDDAFYYKNVGDTSFTLCDDGDGIKHATSDWDWTITYGSGGSCNGYGNGGGFVMHISSSGNSDAIYGLNSYSNFKNWENLSAFIR